MTWWYFLVVGLGAAGGQLAMTHAYQLERASVVGPFSYATVIWSALLGWALFGEPVNLMSGLGIGLIIGAGTWLGSLAGRGE